MVGAWGSSVTYQVRERENDIRRHLLAAGRCDLGASTSNEQPEVQSGHVEEISRLHAIVVTYSYVKNMVESFVPDTLLLHRDAGESDALGARVLLV